jgi:hypothetical protein
MLETTSAAAGQVETACLAEVDFTGGRTKEDAESKGPLQIYSRKKWSFNATTVSSCAHSTKQPRNPFKIIFHSASCFSVLHIEVTMVSR